MPQHVLDSMPEDLFLDGEFWYALLQYIQAVIDLRTVTRFGRDNFQEAMKLAYRMEEGNIDWSKFKYMVFDAPNHSGTYQERYAHLGS